VIVENEREVVIRVHGLAKSFGTHQIWDGLNLDVFRGEILAIVGGSGQGKSVLMRVITGLVKPDSGEVALFGHNAKTLGPQARLAIERRWGILFQDGALFSSLTVLQNIQVPMREHLELPQAMMDDLAFLKLTMVGLPPNAAHKFPSELSGGMRKRAGLARALALDPEIVFLDEPTAGLDPIGATDFDHLIRKLQQTLGLTVYMVTHDLDTIFTVCDRVAVLADKRIVRTGSPTELQHHPNHPWIKEYFCGERARSRSRHAPDQLMRVERNRHGENQANYLMIGGFVLGVLALAFLFVFWMSNFGSGGKRYKIVFESSVAGLTTGSSVGFNGIKVGEVQSFSLDPEDARKVQVIVSVRSDTPVRENSRASIQSMGLTGGSAIQITAGTPTARTVEPI
jgi:phospholipid/cholesterol/gamma-HCH transport system ATP-binding protein